jgi:WD40 repeat protein
MIRPRTLPHRMMAPESTAKSTVSPPAQSKRPTSKHKFEGHESDIEGFVFLHDNVHIVSGSADGTMRKWDRNTGLLIGRPWTWEGGRVLALSPDGAVIACGREDGSVQRWRTNGEMIEGVWTGHRDMVQSLSWSPSGGHLASGSDDGTILIRKAGSGEVEVGPIKTKQGKVYSVAHSPSGDRIASGGHNETICIWNSKTGVLLVGPIKGLGLDVMSLVWSLDSSKLYSASYKSARVYDSISGRLLHSFEHGSLLLSIALSPKHNVLACVGFNGIAQLWDTELYQPLGQPFSREDRGCLSCVSFSPDGRYLAYGGANKKIILWMVKDIAPGLQVSAFMIIFQRDKLHSRTLRTLHPSPHRRLPVASALVLSGLIFS